VTRHWMHWFVVDVQSLEADHDHLFRGDVYTPDLLTTWVEMKRASADEVALRPHPYVFFLYSDV
jgi:glutamine synthetase